MKKNFNTYSEAWSFVYNLVMHGYDYDKQAEACEAFKDIFAACKEMDRIDPNMEEAE